MKVLQRSPGRERREEEAEMKVLQRPPGRERGEEGGGCDRCAKAFHRRGGGGEVGSHSGGLFQREVLLADGMDAVRRAPREGRAEMPGSSLPSRNSIIAPPPLDTWSM